MRIALLGLPKSGKTTVFNALTKAAVALDAYSSAKAEPNIAVVNVGDPRVDALSAMYKPKKTIHATVEIADPVGVTQDDTKKNTIPEDLIRLIKNMDAIAIVLRNFPSDLAGPIQPVKELAHIEEALLLSDLIIVEGRVEKIASMIKKGQKSPALLVEEKLIQKLQTQLNDMKPIRSLEFSAEEKKLMKSYQFLTDKPVLVVVNSDEARFGKDLALLSQLSSSHTAIEFAGSFEMELSRLSDQAEMQAFMADMGIHESARDRLTAGAYAALGYISFFTVGEDEVRAWNVVRGANAVDAAGTIHTDLARGFIRAECFSYSDLVECGSEKAVKEKGKLRLEGKDYVVNDGDILNIRFAV